MNTSVKTSTRTFNATLNLEKKTAKKGKTIKIQDDQDFTPRKNIKSDSRYHWSLKQQIKYVDFLVNKKSLFQMSLQDRKSQGVHTKMSKIIKSRNPHQCRSHHQKMLIKYGNIENIISQWKSSHQKISKMTQPVEQNHLQSESISQIKEEELKFEMKEDEISKPSEEQLPMTPSDFDDLIKMENDLDDVFCFFQEDKSISQGLNFFSKEYEDRMPISWSDLDLIE